MFETRKSPNHWTIFAILFFQIVALGAVHGLLHAAEEGSDKNYLKLEQKLKATTNPIGKVKTLIEMADFQLRGAAHKAMENLFTEADQYLSRYQDVIRQTQEVLKGSGRNAQKKTGGFMDFELALKRQLRTLEDLRSVYPYERSQKLKGTIEEAKAAQENMLMQIFGEGNFGNQKKEK